MKEGLPRVEVQLLRGIVAAVVVKLAVYVGNAIRDMCKYPGVGGLACASVSKIRTHLLWPPSRQKTRTRDGVVCVNQEMDGRVSVGGRERGGRPKQGKGKMASHPASQPQTNTSLHQPLSEFSPTHGTHLVPVDEAAVAAPHGGSGSVAVSLY